MKLLVAILLLALCVPALSIRTTADRLHRLQTRSRLETSTAVGDKPFSQTCKNKVTFWDTPATDCSKRYHAVSKGSWHYWVTAKYEPKVVFASLPTESGPGFYTTCDAAKAKEYAKGAGFVLHITSDTLTDAKKDCITYEKMMEDHPDWDISKAAITAGDADKTASAMPSEEGAVKEWNKNWYLDDSHRQLNIDCKCIVRQAGKQYKFCPQAMPNKQAVKFMDTFQVMVGKAGKLKGNPKVACVDVICKNQKVADCVTTAEAQVDLWDWDTCKKKTEKKSVDLSTLEKLPNPEKEIVVTKSDEPALKQDEANVKCEGEKCHMTVKLDPVQVSQQQDAPLVDIPDCSGFKCESLGGDLYIVKGTGPNYAKCKQALKDKVFICDAGTFKKQ